MAARGSGRISVTCILFFITASACHNNSSHENISHYAPAAANDTIHSSGGLLKYTRGQEIFQTRCIVCHGISGDAEYKGNSRYTKAANLQLSRLDSVEIINAIVNGRNGMPMFDHSMPDSDLVQLVLYVRSLRKP